MYSQLHVHGLVKHMYIQLVVVLQALSHLSLICMLALYRSDTCKELTRLCGTLNLVEPGDSVMADKGFVIGYNIRYFMMLYSISQVYEAYPAVLYYRFCCSPSLVSLAEQIWSVCAALTLFHRCVEGDTVDLQLLMLHMYIHAQ